MFTLSQEMLDIVNYRKESNLLFDVGAVSYTHLAGNVVVHGIFASVPYCIQLLEGPYVETAPEVVAAFRPKSARRDVSE